MSPEPGYDPTWSPSGARIAFVSAPYRRSRRYGVVLDNNASTPTKRDTIAIWDVKDGRLQTLSPTASRGKTILSPVWQDDSHLVYLAVDLHSIGMRRRARLLWNTTFAYRGATQKKDAIILDIESREVTLVAKDAPLMYLEALHSDSGKVALWWYVDANRGGAHPKWFANWVDRRGEVAGRSGLPEGAWSAPAVATLRLHDAVAVRRDGEGVYSLVRISGGRARDLYRPKAVILGAYGSPDRRTVAFLQAIPGIPPAVRMDVKVIPWTGGAPIEVASDASSMSQITWSPDGTQIAYCRAADGRIVVARVPEK